MSKYFTHKVILVSIVILLVVLACNVPGGNDGETDTSLSTPPQEMEQEAPTAEIIEPTQAQQAVDVPSENVFGPEFADYPAVMVKVPDKFINDYTLPISLDDVEKTEFVELSAQQKELLQQNGFVVAAPVPGEYREFYQVYESIRYYDGQPAFITTDSVFHVYHLLFDKFLRDLERDYFIPDLNVLTQEMLKASQSQYQQLKGTALEEQARRNTAFFSVAAQLLALPDPIPPEAADLVNAELELINAASANEVSPTWFREDLPDEDLLIEIYNQYIPRGHYTRSEELKQYFKAMMWYGRLTFRLKDDFETQRALLLIHALRNTTDPDGIPLSQYWQNIYEPTVFIVGKADDLSYFEYGAISDAVFGENPELTDFADEVLFGQFVATAGELPPPQVNSMWVWIWQDRDEATQGFRFMGQRFTLDAYVFGQVIWRNVGTMADPRDLPKGLDFFAAMGSEEALDILNEMGEAEYANYTTQMEKARNEVAALEMDSWTQNLYWSWLYTFQPMIEPKDESYPNFMQTQAWTRKDLHTALGSWTELKHDTILYAKQVIAEMGGGGPDETPKGYVEPNPEVYARMFALAQMTYDGLDSRELLSSEMGYTLQDLIDLLEFLQSASERELAGELLTDDEYWRIAYYGGALEYFTLAAADKEGSEGSPVLEDQKAALIADVATGMEEVLEEAIGQPTPIYVVLPDHPWRLAVGAVFTYYEFTVPHSKRMTDEEWQAQVESGANPPAPQWTGMFIAP